MTQVILNTDGGVRTGGVKGPTQGRSGPASIGFVIRTAGGNMILRQGGKQIGEATVNEAEYSAVICGLFNAYAIGATSVRVLSDSKLIVNQLRGVWQVHEARLRHYVAEVKAQEKRFQTVTYEWVPRGQNMLADALTREALDA